MAQLTSNLVWDGTPNFKPKVDWFVFSFLDHAVSSHLYSRIWQDLGQCFCWSNLRLFIQLESNRCLVPVCTEELCLYQKVCGVKGEQSFSKWHFAPSLSVKPKALPKSNFLKRFASNICSKNFRSKYFLSSGIL